MIRRTLTMPDGTELWLLVSQVAHARVSGELVRHWNVEFSTELVAAITHHDDGWAAWEAAPKLDRELGRPYSFMEMPLADALTIWDDSISSARKFGPLSGWTVAGHFFALLANSDHASEPMARDWLRAAADRRAAWLEEWRRFDSSRTLELAQQGQQMLLLADLFSLWLCGDCPVEANRRSILANSAIKLRTDTLFDRFRFTVTECAIRNSLTGHRIEELAWTVAVDPYPCESSPFALAAKAAAVPAHRYSSWHELAETSWPVELHWRLISGGPGSGSGQ
jgi:Protein of unknown function (DUF3891)